MPPNSVIEAIDIKIDYLPEKQVVKEVVKLSLVTECDPKAYLTNLNHGIPQLDVSWLFSDEPW